MDTTLIAKVLPTKKNGKRSIGTGYPISKNLVLTARHVVISPDRDTSKPIVIEWPDIKDDSGNAYTTEVTRIAYDGGDQYDIVLLECKVPSQAHITPLVLSQRFPQSHEKWEGFGYPQIGKNEEVSTREKISILGIFHSPDDNNYKISLTSESDALKKTGWRGLSGAPVFQGRGLYAVIIETPIEREKCFTAVSIPYLLTNVSEFCEMAGYKQPELDFSSATVYLQTKADAKKALFAQISQNENSVEDSPQMIVRYLVKLPIPELLSIICATQKASQTLLVRKALGELVRHLLPSLYGFDFVSKIRADRGNQSVPILEIPYATDVSAEVLMAAADKRPADFRVIELDYEKTVRPGKNRLALPPESGPDAGNNQLQNIEDDLYNRISRGDTVKSMKIAIDEHLFEKRPNRQERKKYTSEDKKMLVKEWLINNETADRPGLYWLLNLSGVESEDEHIKDLAQQLKISYPQITLLSLNMDIGHDLEISENRMFNQLADTQSTD